jgi:hypothetical protein
MQTAKQSKSKNRMANAKLQWLDNGVMRRKQAVLLGRYWTALGHSIRIEPLHYKDHVRVYLKITRRKP